FAANNQLAEQAWNVLRKRKLSIPRDISLVAFDDVPWMSMVQPAITAVAQPTFEMGRRAALPLLRRVEDPTSGRTVDVLVTGMVAPRGLVAVVAELVRAHVPVHPATMLVTPPEERAPLPMPQAYPYFPHERHSVLAASVDPAPTDEGEGWLHVVPGSQRLG